MAKTKKKGRFWIFLLIMVLYAAVFLCLTRWGLMKFWDYIAAFEVSRPEYAMNHYMEGVDAAYLCSKSAPTAGDIDWNLQNAQVYQDYVMQTLTGEISYAKKLSECTDTQNVYVILCGDRALGKVILTPLKADQYGFTPWTVSSETFDFSYLMADTSFVNITVPDDYLVYLNGISLNSNYVTDSEIYSELEEFYDSFQMPYKVTYQAGPFLGEVDLTVTDPSGNTVVIEEDTDLSVFLDNCTQEEETEISAFVDAFLPQYVNFTSNAGENPQRNYNRLIPYIVKDSALADRMYETISGLKWITDRRSKITSVTINRCVNIGQQRYLCDLTYHVDTNDFSGAMQVVANLKLILYKTESGLLAEAMTSY